MALAVFGLGKDAPMVDREVLLVTYRFPPLGGSGVQRALRLAQYLPDAGWRVHVLTSGHTHYPLIDATLDGEPSDDEDHGLSSENVQVHRVLGYEPGGIAATACRWMRRRAVASTTGDTPSLENRLFWRLESWFDHLGLAEAEVLWVPAAIRAARRIIKSHNIRIVVTTSPPHSIQRVGLALQQRAGVRWIADLRDPILDNFGYAPASPKVDRYWRRLERDTVTNASKLIVTCPDLIERLQMRYPDVPRSRYLTVTNGYDQADVPHGIAASSPRRSRFVLGYVGSFYGKQTIEPLMVAMRRLVSSRPDIAGRIELRVVGSVSAQQRRFLNDTDDVFLRLIGYQPHAESVREMAAADSLFLMTPANEGGRYCIPAKTFEYLAFGRHVIALVQEGTATSDVLTEAGNVTLVRHGDSSRLMQAIEDRYESWAAGSPDSPRNRDVVERYRRDRIARQYADVLEACVGSAHEVDPVVETATAWEAA